MARAGSPDRGAWFDIAAATFDNLAAFA